MSELLSASSEQRECGPHPQFEWCAEPVPVQGGTGTTERVGVVGDEGGCGFFWMMGNPFFFFGIALSDSLQTSFVPLKNS